MQQQQRTNRKYDLSDSREESIESTPTTIKRLVFFFSLSSNELKKGQQQQNQNSQQAKCV